MKKLLCLMLTGVLMASLAVPAGAAGDASARLAKVTQAVKDTLDLDTEAYEDFQGECYDEDLAPVWYLSWQKGPNDGTLTVEALEDGTVVSYRLSEGYDGYEMAYGSLPTFPENGDRSESQAVAEAFLAKVLGPEETVELKPATEVERLTSSSQSFSGVIQLKGLDSPLRCSVYVENGQVVRFRRDAAANTFLGDIPAPEASADQAQAAADLRGRQAVKLEYVLPEWDSKEAVLRYVPDGKAHTFYVDANTGKVLDLTELEKDLYGTTTANKEAMAEDSAQPMMAASGGDRGLSQAEQKGVEKLSGVLSAEALDASLRAIEALGLKGYTLTSHSYTLVKERENEESRPQCTLRYTRVEQASGGAKAAPLEMDVAVSDSRMVRTITVDARTGEPQRIYSYTPGDREGTLTLEEAQAKAEAFLKALWPDRDLALYDSGEPSEEIPSFYSFTFARKVNGVFFPTDSYDVSIDSLEGTVCRLNVHWSQDVAFESPEGVISPEAALHAWCDTFDVTLAYRLVPQDLNRNDPAHARLTGQGLKRYYGLMLTYGLERDKSCWGIGAKTGEPVWPEETGAGKAVAYTDLAGHSAQGDIEKLARYGVGYASQEFRPGKVLTQWDFVCLLASVQGWQRLDPATATKDERDSAYSAAYSMGALRRSERNDGAAVTRGDLARMLLDAGGYGPAARLTGIYTTAYSDQASIPKEDLGYAALAQALGMAKGTYGASRNASRADAASMLCRLLERS